MCVNAFAHAYVHGHAHATSAYACVFVCVRVCECVCVCVCSFQVVPEMVFIRFPDVDWAKVRNVEHDAMRRIWANDVFGDPAG